MIDQAVAELEPFVGVRAACAAVGEAQARWYRRHRQSPPPPKPERVPAPQPRALTEVERKLLCPLGVSAPGLERLRQCDRYGAG